MKKTLLIATAIAASASGAQALTIGSSTNAALMASSTLAASSGINIVGGSETFQGGTTQQGLYTGFSLSNSSETLTIDNGVVLTSGSVNDIPNNDSASITATPGAGSDADLDSLSAQTVTNDANYLQFDFTVAAGITSVSLDFLFASDEYPDQSVTDIMGVFVDGTNYAHFSDGSLVSFDLGSPAAGNFKDNDYLGANPFLDAGGGGFEYDGIVDTLSMVGILDGSLSTHTIKIAIGDTSDTAYDSGVFVANLLAGTDTGGGIDPGKVPLPASLPLLFAAFGGLGLMRRKKRAA